VIAVIAFLLSIMFVRDTGAHVALEQTQHHARADEAPPSLRSAFAQATYREPALRSCAQAGLVNNLNDGLAWGLVPLYLAAHGASVGDIGLVAALYPGVWSVAQIATGDWSDRIGRKPLIAGGMLVQAAALGVLALSNGVLVATAAAAVLLGVGTAAGVPDADRGDVRRSHASSAGAHCRRLPLLARQRIRVRRRDRRRRRRRARLRRRDRARRRADSRIRALGAARHAQRASRSRA
jgi:hypothetical protein